MTGELIIVGDEVLDGRVINTNACYLAGRLSALGLPIRRITTVGDAPEEMAEVLLGAAQRSDFVLVTGGLGPTEDDRTTATAAKTFSSPLTLRPEILKRLAAACQDRGREVGLLEKLAWLPAGAEPLNSQADACGFYLCQGRCLVVFLPGVPAEVRGLFDQTVRPLLLTRFPERVAFGQSVLKFFGLSESEAAERLGPVWNQDPEVAFGSYPNFPEVHLSLTAQGIDSQAVQAALDRTEKAVLARLGRFCFGRDNDEMEIVLGRLLREGHLTLATAESCTGGLIAQRITSVPGASAYFIQGVVAYHNRAKEALLGVPAETIQTHGAVSPQTAAAMAEGLKLRSGVDLALSVTGIAGPDGGTPQKPVGLVFFGLAGFGRLVVESHLFKGERRQIQALAAATTLDLARRLVLARDRTEEAA